MKKMLFSLLSIVLLASCGRKFDVKLPNGNIIKAYDADSRNFTSGDTVCINQLDGLNWTIVTGSTRESTINYNRYVNSNGDTVGYFSQYEIGVIK